MTVYADSSAVLKLYLDEVETDEARELLRSDPHWMSSCLTMVEVRRNLVRLLGSDDLARGRTEFLRDWRAVVAIAIDDSACERASVLAERTGVRTLDAMQLEAAERTGAPDGLPIVTFDRRLAQAARSLGWNVLGAR